MLLPGIVSVTFRELSPQAIIDLARDNGLKGIGWGSDVHVPPGKTTLARQLYQRANLVGVETAAYCSYYRLGESPRSEFADILSSAISLSAPRIRVWAGAKPSAEADADYRRAVAEEARRLAGLALKQNIEIVCEWHGGTLTDTNESGLAFLKEVNHSNFGTYWQPPVGASCRNCINALSGLLPYLRGVHVFHWEGTERRPLAEGRERWLRWLNVVAKAPRSIFALLEFVRDDDPANLPADAETLRKMLVTIEH
jgi:3-dehydroshikimate dehydratase